MDDEPQAAHSKAAKESMQLPAFWQRSRSRIKRCARRAVGGEGSIPRGQRMRQAGVMAAALGVGQSATGASELRHQTDRALAQSRDQRALAMGGSVRPEPWARRAIPAHTPGGGRFALAPGFTPIQIDRLTQG